MIKVLSFAKGILRLCSFCNCIAALPKAICMLILCACALNAAPQSKVLAEGSKSLQQAYNNLGVLLEKNKDSTISGKQLKKQLRSLNLATERYLSLPDSMLHAYAQLPAYSTIDSLLKNKVKTLSKRYVQSFLQLNQLNNHISQVKNLENDLSSLYKTDIRSMFSVNQKGFLTHDGFSAAYSGQAGQSLFGGNPYYINNRQLSDGISIANVPLSVVYSFQQFNDAALNSDHVINVQFDKDAFLDSYRKKLQGKLKPEDLIPKDALLESAVKSAELTMHNELSAVKEKYKDLSGEALKKVSSLKNVVTTNITSVREQILGSISLQSIADKERILREMELQMRSGVAVDSARMNILQREIAEEASSMEIFNSIAAHKKKWDSSGLVKKILADEQLRNLRFKELLSNPGSIRQLAGQYLQTGGIQKWLMMVNSLKGGRHATTLDKLSMNNFLSDGVSMEMQSGNKYLFVLFGRQQQFNSLYDAASFSPLQPQGNLAMGMRLGKGDLNGTHSHISIFSYNSQPPSGRSLVSNSLARSNLVLSLSNKFVSGPSTISVEVSHSSTRFKNESKSEISNLPGNETAQRRFADGLAMDVQYDANFEDIKLDLNVNALVTGRDYFNPGNAFLTQGLKQFDLGAQKSFFKNQLQLRMRNNWRQIDFAQLSSSKWRQNLLMLDARWQLNNGQYLGLQYQPMRSVKLDNGAKYTMGITDRLSAAFNFNKRTARFSYTNLLNLSHNRIDQSGGIYNNYKIQSSSVQLNSIQSIAFRKHVVYWNTLYSYVYTKSNTFYTNNVFNADAGFTYAIAKRMHASSGLNYYSVKGWHAVAGVRQTFTASLGQKLQVNVFVDWRTKIKETQYYYHEPLRADCSVRYIF